MSDNSEFCQVVSQPEGGAGHCNCTCPPVPEILAPVRFNYDADAALVAGSPSIPCDTVASPPKATAFGLSLSHQNGILA